MMPKDDAHYWRGLFEGGEERSHIEVRPWMALTRINCHILVFSTAVDCSSLITSPQLAFLQLLKEAVDADEPVVSCDDMDQGAR